MVRVRSVVAIASVVFGIGGCTTVLGLDGEYRARPQGTGDPTGDSGIVDANASDGAIEDGRAQDESQRPDADGAAYDANSSTDAENPCRANLQSSTDHCGVCYHSCLLGTCSDGKCQPGILLEHLSNPLGIALDATYVYLVDDQTSRLYRTPKGAADLERLDVTEDKVSGPFDIAVTTTHLYWSERAANVVFRKPLSGSNRAKQEVVRGAGTAAYLAVSNETAYVTDYRKDQPTVGSVTWNGSDAQEGVLYANQALCAGIAVANDKLYWAHGLDGVLVTGPLAGGQYSNILTGAGSVTGIAVDESYVYWIADNQRVMRAKLDGTNSEPLYEATLPFTLGDIAVDNDAVYWSEGKNGLIRKLAK